MLSYQCHTGVKYSPGIHPTHDWILGAQAYYVSRERALKLLQLFEQNPANIKSHTRTAELLPRWGQGVFVSPPIVIDECGFSSINGDKYIEVFKKFYGQFGWENYDE